MRPRLIGGLAALALGGCASDVPGPVTLSLRAGSAGGGDEVCVSADEIDAGQTLVFGELDALDGRRDGDGALCGTTPPGTAGPVDVRVEGKGGVAVLDLEAAFTYLPLDLVFSPSAAHHLPPPPVALSAGVVVDVDADGLDDVVVGDAGGGLQVWRSTGAGTLELVRGPAFDGPVVGLAVLPAVEAEAPAHLLACLADGEAPRLFAIRDGALAEVRGGVPTSAGTCTGATALDLDGDGALEAVELRADGVRAWQVGPNGLAPWRRAAPVEADGCGGLRGTDSDTAVCTVSGGAASLFVETDRAIALDLTLPPVMRVDDGLRLRATGDLHELRVRDAADERFIWVTDGAAGTVEAPPVSTWVPDTEGAEPQLPLGRLSLVGDGERSGGVVALQVSEVTLLLPDGGEAVAATWEATPLDLELAPTALAVLDADADGLPELLVGTATGPRLWVPDGDGFAPGPVGALPDLPDCDVGALVAVDVDGDDRAEVFVACGGQDRLLRADGTGRLFDDTAAALPIDGAVGVAAAAADLERDGRPELLISADGSVDRLYRGDGARFEDWSGRLDLLPGPGVALLPVDLDGDADLDLVSLQGDGEPSRLYLMTGD
jgi:hypothetical protein